MSSDRSIGPALPPMFRKQGNDEDSDEEKECMYKANVFSTVLDQPTYMHYDFIII